MSDEKKENVKDKVDDLLPQSLKDELPPKADPPLAEKKEGRKFIWITIGIVLLVIINISLSVATIVLVVSRPAPGQFLNNNTQPLQRFRN